MALPEEDLLVPYGKSYYVRRHFIQKCKCKFLFALTTAADDKFCDIFHNFRKKEGMIFHENRLPADDSHEIHALFAIFEKAAKS